MSERPGSNWPPEAWKATALPNELLSQISLLPKNTIKGQTQTLDTNKELFEQSHFKKTKVGRVGFEPTYS